MRVRRVPAGELRPGDVVELSTGPAEVIGEPFLGQSGAGIFDALELFWRARVRPLADGVRVSYATWRLHERVPLHGEAGGA